jgi:hypothetical protein
MQKSKHNDLAEKIYQRIKGTPGMDDHELRQHAMLLDMTPEQRCEYSVRMARLALSLRRSLKPKPRNNQVNQKATSVC